MMAAADNHPPGNKQCDDYEVNSEKDKGIGVTLGGTSSSTGTSDVSFKLVATAETAAALLDKEKHSEQQVDCRDKEFVESEDEAVSAEAPSEAGEVPVDSSESSPSESENEENQSSTAECSMVEVCQQQPSLPLPTEECTTPTRKGKSSATSGPSDKTFVVDAQATDPPMSELTAPSNDIKPVAMTRVAASTNNTTWVRIPSHAAIKVIKGEIHNVLTMMRATDQRYVSRSRFTTEHHPNAVSSTTAHHHHHQYYHPVAQALQDLHAQLTTAATSADDDEVVQEWLNQHNYLEAFCFAITSRDISAPVTGVCLAALHKFLLYGFVCNNNKSSTGMTRIAQALLECQFEESSTTTSPERRTAFGSSSNGGAADRRGSVAGVVSSSTTSGSSSSSSFLHHHPTAAVPYDDEQTVLKLLDVAALTVRKSLQAVENPSKNNHNTHHLQLDCSTLVRLLDACLHVTHRAETASPLLKSAAASALSQIVLQVFSAQHPAVLPARRDILAKLAQLLNPVVPGGSTTTTTTAPRASTPKTTKKSSLQPANMVVASSLELVNIALETCREPLVWGEIEILQNDVCKYLLQWSSTTHDLYLLSLTLRVIFNLFQSIRNHLKVPLEVFLTSVHLRILNDDDNSATHSYYSPEEKEVALESLLEFCQEPALMQDIFLNYDCDVACTNLYEAIVTQLGRAATPVGWKVPRDDAEHYCEESSGTTNIGSDSGEGSVANNNNGDGNSKRGTTATIVHKRVASLSTDPSGMLTDERGMSPVTHLQRLSVEGLLAVLDSIAKRCREMKRSSSSLSQSMDGLDDKSSAVTTEGDNHRSDNDNDDDESSIDTAAFPKISSQELHERKLRKHALNKVARVFNAEPTKEAWLKLAVREKLIDSDTSATSVAELLYIAPDLDKASVGIYLSKGPDKDFPFQAAVRLAFLDLYDFSGLTFAAALRKYLSKFRLPGEAQCIDRLMEAFSKKLYGQQGESMFKNSDAIYVLAFSTIMLNTDLHNPTIKREQRMTREQFIRNNRGINGGGDLPTDYLGELYDQIKENEIQVRRELGEFMKKHEHEDFRTVWENMLSKSSEVATPFFTPTGLGRSSSRVAGFHDREMFIVLAKSAVQAFSGIFLRSWDDALVVKALDALRTMVGVAAYLECDSTMNDILQILLPHGRDYILNCITADNVHADALSVISSRVADESADEDDTSQQDEAEQPIPYGLLCSNGCEDQEEVDISGSATHRGLLAMDCAFILMRKYSSRLGAAWPEFVECLCLLRDASALPAGLSDLDDFADSSGNILPLSSFAILSQKRLIEFYKSQSEKDTQKSKSWFRSFFRKKSFDSVKLSDDVSLPDKQGELSATARALLAVAEAAGVENVIQVESTRLPDTGAAIQSLLDKLDAFPYKNDPVGEQHAIFSLELAARALLSNKDRATDLFILFLVKFESILAQVSLKKVPAPFVVERIVVTILRCCIHLFDVPEVRVMTYSTSDCASVSMN
jgi:golgi-specific brefeldin A-resistance guanine nucleotide exchange factor 1